MLVTTVKRHHALCSLKMSSVFYESEKFQFSSNRRASSGPRVWFSSSQSYQVPDLPVVCKGYYHAHFIEVTGAEE